MRTQFWPSAIPSENFGRRCKKSLKNWSFLTRLRLKSYGGQAADYTDITDQRANDKNRKPTWCPRNMRMRRKRYILPKFSRLFASLVGAKSLPPSPSSFRTLSRAGKGNKDSVLTTLKNLRFLFPIKSFCLDLADADCCDSPATPELPMLILSLLAKKCPANEPTAMLS